MVRAQLGPVEGIGY
uniref:Uncharacterized protein n=1 Tax=Rhizophora mucronata TaxID=61149 RepID=A0A2P2N5D4_RHIMU